MIAGILLAAGRSSRFGCDKRLHLLDGGLPMVLTAARRLAGACDRCYIVIGPDDSTLAHLFAAENMHLVQCSAANEGMGRSLACGVAAAREAKAYVVALADMPYLRVDTIMRVVNELRAGSGCVVLRYRGIRGHPVGFSARFRSSLLALRGDHGAREVLDSLEHAVRYLDVSDSGVVRDVDRPEDTERFMLSD